MRRPCCVDRPRARIFTRRSETSICRQQRHLRFSQRCRREVDRIALPGTGDLVALTHAIFTRSLGARCRAGRTPGHVVTKLRVFSAGSAGSAGSGGTEIPLSSTRVHAFLFFRKSKIAVRMVIRDFHCHQCQHCRSSSTAADGADGANSLKKPDLSSSLRWLWPWMSPHHAAEWQPQAGL